MMKSKFYTYVHCRPDKKGIESVFYGGKGKENRANYLKRNRHHANIVNKFGAENITIKIIGIYDTEREAFDAEIALISAVRQSGANLTNLTDGGEGASGLVFSAEARAKMSKAQKGRTYSLETSAKISEAKKAYWEAKKQRQNIKVVA